MYIGFVIVFLFSLSFLVDNGQVWVVFTLAFGILGKRIIASNVECESSVLDERCESYDLFRVVFFKWLMLLFSLYPVFCYN